MGRTYKKELTLLPETLKWSLTNLDTSNALKIFNLIRNNNLLVVGSGGSFSAASYIAKIHEFSTGRLSKALTPLEFSLLNSTPINTAVIFLTSSGNNKDILDAFKISKTKPYDFKIVLCLNEKGKLVQSLGNKSNTLCVAHTNPIGKDGFLAVNSLISFCIIAARAYGLIGKPNQFYKQLIGNFPQLKLQQWRNILTKNTILSIGGEWSTPVLIDLESKFSEAALGNVLISDFRNFGHGRHNWIDKKGNDSSLITFDTPTTKAISNRTVKYLPDFLPVSRIETEIDGPLGTIDLFIHLFHLVSLAAEILNVDPGRPKVPDFGRKLYRIGIPSKRNKNLSNLTKNIWLDRKSAVTGRTSNNIKNFLEEFLLSINKAHFRAVVFDYDGTLISENERFTKPNLEISNFLNKLLENDIPVGIATGRGKSVQHSLRECIKRKFWKKVVIGNYNGSFVKFLNEDIPTNYKKPIKYIEKVSMLLSKNYLISKQLIEVRRKQISISPKDNFDLGSLLNIIKEELYNFKDVRVFKSDHSVDIIHNSASKLILLERLSGLFNVHTDKVLKVGDQGHIVGNDYELLSEPFSLSVNKVSSSLNTCWNISPIGLECSLATEAILRSMVFDKDEFSIDTKLLMSGVSL